MASTYKILGQSFPSASVETELYTVPTNSSSVCSTLCVCAISASDTFRVVTRQSGSNTEGKHYLIYDNYVNQYDSIFLTLGLTLNSNDSVIVSSRSGSLSFNLFGSEIS